MIRSKLSSWREYLTPVSHKSSFEKTGEITPEEFVRAGNYLVYKFPTWKWGSASKSKQWSFLPANKQFLVTEHVPCSQWASVVDNAVQSVVGDEGSDDGDGWVFSTSNTQNQSENEVASLEEVPDADLEGLEEADLEGELGEPVDPPVGNQAHSQHRTYNVYITYSTSYRVPKIYLSGFDDNGTPLAPRDMFDDIIGDYKDKTVTIEPSPFLDNQTMISIHPCRHARVMTLLLNKSDPKESEASDDAKPDTDNQDSADEWEEVPSGTRVDQYLVVFLKFIASVTPTIEHDFTMSAL